MEYFYHSRAKAGKHHIKVTDQRSRKEYAIFMKWAIMEQFSKAQKVRIVRDNLNTHFKKSFYETFTKAESEEILKRAQFIYTIKHASWLNIAKIEINLLDKEGWGRNIPNQKDLEKEVQAWSDQSNAEKKNTMALYQIQGR